MKHRAMNRAMPGKAGNPLSDPDRWSAEYGDYLLRYALRHVRDRHIAEDLVQETWLAAWQARARFAGASSERTWLTGILRHKVVDHIRQAGRERWSADPHESPLDSAASAAVATWSVAESVRADPARQLERNQLYAALHGCLCGLSHLMKQVFAHCDLDESLPGDVAHRLGITPGHVYVLLHRARKRIKRCLTSHVVEGETPVSTTAEWPR